MTKYKPPGWSFLTMRVDERESALLLFLFGGCRSLRGLRLDHALLEFIHAPGRIHKFLLAGEERMARIANPDDDHWFGGPGFDHVAAGATDFGVHILRMNIC